MIYESTQGYEIVKTKKAGDIAIAKHKGSIAQAWVKGIVQALAG